MPDINPKTGPTYVDGIGSTTAIDTAGEIVDLAGIDCSSFIGGALNWEHKGDTPAQLVGKILEYKKIFSEADCENDRHKYYWDKCKTPYLYVMGRLFDDKKESSRECAALFMDDAEHPDEHPMVGFSIEGSKVDKKGIIVTKSIARKMTITHVPANKQCIAEMMPAQETTKPDPDSIFKSEPSHTIELFEKSEKLSKAQVPGSIHPPAAQASLKPKAPSTGMKYGPMETKPKDLGKEIGKTKSGKSIMSHAKPTDYKGFSAQEHQEAANFHMAHAEEGKGIPGASHFDTAKRHMALAGRGERQGAKAQAGRQEAVKKPDMNVGRMGKSLTAGSGMSAPGNLVQGAALGKESMDKKMKKTELTKARVDEGKTPEQKAWDRSGRNERTSTSTTTWTKEPGKVGKFLGAKPKTKAHEKVKSHGAAGPTNVRFGTQATPGHAPKTSEGFDGEKIESSRKVTGTPARTPNIPKTSFKHAKIGKSEALLRAEQEYSNWTKREEFENFMSKAMPHLTKSEVKVIGQTLCLNKSMKAEKELKKMMARPSLHSYIDKKEKK